MQRWKGGERKEEERNEGGDSIQTELAIESKPKTCSSGNNWGWQWVIWSPCKQQWVVVTCKCIRSGCVCCLCFEPDLSLLVVNCCMNSYTNLYWLLLLTTCTSLVSLLGSNLTRHLLWGDLSRWTLRPGCRVHVHFNKSLALSLSWVVTCHIRWQDVSWVVVKGVLLWQLQHSGRSLACQVLWGQWLLNR